MWLKKKIGRNNDATLCDGMMMVNLNIHTFSIEKFKSQIHDINSRKISFLYFPFAIFIVGISFGFFLFPEYTDFFFYFTDVLSRIVWTVFIS